MRKRLLLVLGIFICLAASASQSAADMYARIFPLTGELQFYTYTPVSFVYYQIKSASGALNPSPSVWKSVTENYDAPIGATPGNGAVDATGEWVKIKSLSTELTEGALGLPGGSLAPQRGVNLGRIWDPHKVPIPDLVFDVVQSGGQSIPVILDPALAGDYDMSGTVDQTDYGLWRQWFGSTSVLIADGNLNGVVDTADYSIWRDNLGKTLPLPPYASGSGASLTNSSSVVGSVPEPAGGVLLAIAALVLPMIRRRRS